MSGFRPSALFPLVTSAISFALILVLVLSGTNPNLISDAYLLSFNTTNLGQNLVQIAPATPVSSTNPSAVAGRDVRTAKWMSSRSIIADSAASNATLNSTAITRPSNSSTSSSNSPSLGSSASNSPNVNVSQSATANSNTSSLVAPTLAIPQAATAAVPGAIPVAAIGAFFQLTLNTFATGMGDSLQAIITLLVTTAKQTYGVSEFYTVHVSGVCQGTVFNTSTTNLTSPLNITRCVSYNEIGGYVSNLTSNISESQFVGDANITVPALGKVPGLGKQGKSLIDLIAGVVLAVFIIGLIGNALSIILSVAAFVAPSLAPNFGYRIHTTGAATTTLSSQLLQTAAITSTTLSIGISTAINGFSDVSGITASIGGKYLALIWFGYITAQMANAYWMQTWFVKFRKIAFKARERTPLQMSSYKGIWKEVRSDFKVEKVEDDTEVLIRGSGGEIRHWNDDYKTQ